MIPVLLTLEPTTVNNPETSRMQTVYCLNIRTAGTMNELAEASRKNIGTFLLPNAEDEKPDLIMPEFEPDPEKVAKDIEELFPPGGSQSTDSKVIDSTAAPAEEEPKKRKSKPKPKQALADEDMPPADAGPEPPLDEEPPDPEPTLEEEPQDLTPIFEPIDLAWLRTSLEIIQKAGVAGWSNANVVAHLNSVAGVKTVAAVSKAVAVLDHKQAETFVKAVQEQLDKLNK